MTFYSGGLPLYNGPPYSCCIIYLKYIYVQELTHLVRPCFALHANFGGFVKVPTRGAGAGRHAYRPGVVPPDATGRTRGARGGAVYASAPFKGVVETRLALALGDRFCPLSRCSEGISYIHNKKADR